MNDIFIKLMLSCGFVFCLLVSVITGYIYLSDPDSLEIERLKKSVILRVLCTASIYGFILSVLGYIWSM